MAEFERGDVVVYVHPNTSVDKHGSLAIVERTRDDLVDVYWVSVHPWLMSIFDGSTEPEDFWRTNWTREAFEKVGHIDLPTG